jgi:hypothetical protein
MSARSVNVATLNGSNGVVLGAAETNTVVSTEVQLMGPGVYLRCEFTASSVTAGAGITAKLQHKSAGTWTDVTGATAAITTNASSAILVHPHPITAGTTTDNPVYGAWVTQYPLGTQVRLVVTTGAGSAATITNVRFIQ